MAGTLWYMIASQAVLIYTLRNDVSLLIQVTKQNAHLYGTFFEWHHPNVCTQSRAEDRFDGLHTSLLSRRIVLSHCPHVCHVINRLLKHRQVICTCSQGSSKCEVRVHRRIDIGWDTHSRSRNEILDWIGIFLLVCWYDNGLALQRCASSVVKWITSVLTHHWQFPVVFLSKQCLQACLPTGMCTHIHVQTYFIYSRLYALTFAIRNVQNTPCRFLRP